MSWHGKHPILSKAEAKRMLPPGACKLCVYWVRCRKSASDSCTRCGSIKGDKYRTDLSKILGAIQQSGRYLWQTVLPPDLALLGLIRRKIVTYQETQGIFAIYVPLVNEFLRFKLK